MFQSESQKHKLINILFLLLDITSFKFVLFMRCNGFVYQNIILAITFNRNDHDLGPTIDCMNALFVNVLFIMFIHSQTCSSKLCHFFYESKFNRLRAGCG